MQFIGRFMVEFGLVSSAFDVLTFVLLLSGFAAGVETFRTAWFVESLLTEFVVALVVRTGRPFCASWPGAVLLASTVTLIVVALVVPYRPFVRPLGFVPLPAGLLAMLCLITAAYVLATELLKRWFFRPRAPVTVVSS